MIEEDTHNLTMQIVREFNQEGNVIISNGFCKTKYELKPLPKREPEYQ